MYEIKNVLKMNLKSMNKKRTFQEHLKLKTAIFLRTLNLGSKNVVLIKKKLDNQLDDGCRMNRGLIERSGGTAQFKEMAESKIEKVASFRIGNTSKTEKTG